MTKSGGVMQLWHSAVVARCNGGMTRRQQVAWGMAEDDSNVDNNGGSRWWWEAGNGRWRQQRGGRWRWQGLFMFYKHQTNCIMHLSHLSHLSQFCHICCICCICRICLICRICCMQQMQHPNQHTQQMQQAVRFQKKPSMIRLSDCLKTHWDFGRTENTARCVSSQHLQTDFFVSSFVCFLEKKKREVGLIYQIQTWFFQALRLQSCSTRLYVQLSTEW